MSLFASYERNEYMDCSLNWWLEGLTGGVDNIISRWLSWLSSFMVCKAVWMDIYISCFWFSVMLELPSQSIYVPLLCGWQLGLWWCCSFVITNLMFVSCPFIMTTYKALMMEIVITKTESSKSFYCVWKCDCYVFFQWEHHDGAASYLPWSSDCDYIPGKCGISQALCIILHCMN